MSSAADSVFLLRPAAKYSQLAAAAASARFPEFRPRQEQQTTSSMAWYPLPQTGGTMSTGDEFFENQSAGWSLWSFSAFDDQNTTCGCVYSVNQEDGDAPCTCTGPAEEDLSEAEGPAPFEEPRFIQPTEDIFLSQFSDEEMRRMDAPFEALDMFPDSMHRLLSYENMLTGVLTGSEEGDAKLDRNGVDTMDTCGFPLFSHDLQNGSRNAEQSNPEILLLAGPSSEEEDKAGLSMAKRSRPIAGTESTPGFEALVLEELEDVVLQLTKRTRICYRDAFYRLAASSKANSSTANGATEVGSSASRQSFQQPDGNNASARFSTTPGCHERETNPIDRTVMVLTMKPPRQLHGNCCADDSGAEAQSTTSWTTRVA